MLLVPKKKSALKSKDFFTFVCTPYVFKKGYTYDAFLTSTIKVMLVKDMLVSLFKKLVRQLQMVLGNRGELQVSLKTFRLTCSCSQWLPALVFYI
jgi:hypothetical protein